MRLFVIRHGIAEETSPSGRDADRRLTKEGREKLEAIAAALARHDLVPSRLVTSPLVRARETAKILKDELEIEPAIEVCEAITPHATPNEMVAGLRPFATGDDLAMVGHLPSAALLVGALIGCANEDAIELKKGGIALIEFAGGIALGRGTLRLLLAPKVLG